jgi:IclR family transcriptional regulator, pca regulon regulatory protein
MQYNTGRCQPVPPADIKPPNSKSGRDPLMILSVEKSFRILLAFDADMPTAGLTQIARRTGLDRSTVQRFVHTLAALGYLRRDRRTRQFALGVRTLDIAHRFTTTDPLITLARPYLQHLQKVTGETVNLSVLEGQEVVYIARFEGQHVLNIEVGIGSRRPVYCSAPGIAMLSALPSAEAAALLDRCDPRPITAATVWRKDALMAKIAATARRGYATAFEEIHLGDLSIAAPIVDPAGRPLGAINVAALRSRMEPARMEQTFAPTVLDVALSISQGCAAFG